MMQLLSLRYQKYPQAEEKVFSVRSRSGQFSNIAAFFTDSDQAHELVGALSHLFGSTRPCFAVSLEWSDSTGSLWKMQRQNQVTTLLKNGDISTEEVTFRPYQIDLLDPQPKALPLHMDQSLYTQATQLSQQACQAAHLPELPPLRVAALAEQLDRLRTRYQSLAFLHKKQSPRDPVADPLELRKELHLIHQIQDQMEGLKNSSQMQLIETITKIQEEIESILKDSELKSIPSHDFEKTLELAAQRAFLQKGLEMAKDIIARGEDSLCLVAESSWSLTDQNLAQNFELSEELQREFDKTVQALSIQSEQQMNWFDKFRKGQQKSEPLDREKIQSLRDHLHITLSKLNQLREHLYENETDFHLPLKNIQKWYENQAKRKKSLDQKWSDLHQKSNLPANMTLKQLIHLATQFGRLTELHSEHKRLTFQLKWRQQKIENIRKFLLDWRQLTKSHHSSELNNPAVILSEAKTLINLGHKKQKSHDILTRSYGDYQAQNKLLQNIEHAGENIKKEWNQCFTSLGISPLDINESNGLQFIRDGLLVRALTRNHEECLPFSSQSELFALWHIVGEGHIEDVLQQSRRAHTDTLHFIIASQKKPESSDIPDFCQVFLTEKPAKQVTAPPSQGQPRPTPNLQKKSQQHTRQNVQQVLDLLNGGKKPRVQHNSKTTQS